MANKRRTQQRESREMGGTKGNKNALKWTEPKLKKLAEQVVSIAKDEKCFSLAKIFNEIGILPNTFLDLVKRYNVVSEAYEVARSQLLQRYEEMAVSGSGHQAFLMKMIPYYNKQLHSFDLDTLDKQEKIKTDHKIRSQKALVDDSKEAFSTVIEEASKAIQESSLKKKK